MSQVPRHQISGVIARRAMTSSSADELAQEIAAYLLAERRTADIESVLRDVWQYRADHGLVEVRATSAFALTADNRQAIEAQVRELYPQAEQVIISERQDPSVIGGVRLELANQQLDASLRAKLNHFKQLTTAGKD